MVVRTQICNFSGFRIYPGHGSTFVRSDGKVFVFANSKCKSSFHMRRKPASLNWTYIYRRLHRKGQEEQEKRRTRRRAVKTVQKPVEGASIEVLRAKRQAPRAQVKTAARAAALKEIKARQQGSGGAGGGNSSGAGAKPKK
jgi:large subunit ribosomal protein L24e